MEPLPLPRTLLAEIGRVATTWAYIEQDLILHTSAMAAQDTDGKPIEYLRMDFKRLREKWYSQCRKRFPGDIFNKIVHPLNTKLARLSMERGYVIHGMWSVIGRGKYRLRIFEQKQLLESYAAPYTLTEIRRFAAASDRALFELKRFTTGQNSSFKNRERSVSKIIDAVVSDDED